MSCQTAKRFLKRIRAIPYDIILYDSVHKWTGNRSPGMLAAGGERKDIPFISLVPGPWGEEKRRWSASRRVPPIPF